jgi:splicing factor 3B subunit 3
VLLWAGLQGTIGLLIPFIGREDVDFFQALEMQMRQEDAPLAGRDHLMYRSYYIPSKGVIDGDLCERYVRLDSSLRERIAAELERDPREVERKISVSDPY